MTKLVMIGWGINIVAWGAFVMTGEPAIEAIMGVACLGAAYIGYREKVKYLIFVALADAVWMFGWAFSGNF